MAASPSTDAQLPPEPAREAYQRQLDQTQREIERLQTRQATFVWIRTGLFFLTVGLLLLGSFGDALRELLLSLAAVTGLAFLVAIVWNEHLRLQRLHYDSDARLFRRLLARLDRNWSALPPTRLLPEFQDVAFADDLDVAGGASLLSLLSLAGTRCGRQTLQQWIIEPPSWDEVHKRQAGVQELQGRRELRLSIIRTILSSSDGTEDVFGLPKWASTPNWLDQNWIPRVFCFIGPIALFIGLLILPVGAAVNVPLLLNAGAVLFFIGGAINLGLTVFWGSWVHEIFKQVTGQHQAVYQFAEVFDSFETLPQDGGLLEDIRNVSVVVPHSARRGFAKLLWHVRLANLQRDPLMYFVYLALQFAVAWDFHILRRLEGWKQDFGPHVSKWFDALGCCEALISGATLADENRMWTYPEPPAAPNTLLHANNLGHPLLPDNGRVTNDLELDAERPLLLVTGSNMAGKSTFMRAIGLNLLLARTGSPICGDRLQTSLFEIASSIRVRDSLRDGVSFFMAELNRLKEVVDLATQHSSNSEVPILFLLDEVLQGTNSQERQIAVASVVKKLLRNGAAGLLSTHDLDLAAAEDIQAISQIVHFREFFETHDGREVMRFDYKMRPGPTPTTNALKLLSLVGLDADAEG